MVILRPLGVGLLCPPSSIGKTVGYSLGQVIVLVCSDLSFDSTICKFDVNVIIPFYVLYISFNKKKIKKSIFDAGNLFYPCFS